MLHLAGTVAAQRGNYAKAVENYDASLAIRERAGDRASMASLLSNLGIVAEYRGDYERARALHERALALRMEIGDRWAIGNSTNCLGMIAVHQKRFSEARDWFQKSMSLNREVGDDWMVAICHNNLGNATRGLGDYAAARRHYADSLRAYRAFDDRWALAFLLEDIGILAAFDGDAPSALELMGAAEHCARRSARRAPHPSRRRSRSNLRLRYPLCPHRIAWRIERAGNRWILPLPSTLHSHAARRGEAPRVACRVVHRNR